MKRKPDPDAVLLAKTTAFRVLYRVNKAAWQKQIAFRAAVEAEPDCPPFTVGNGPFHRQPYYRYLEKRGVWKAHDAASAKLAASGKAARAVFAKRATTLRGVLAKLEIVELAYGSGGKAGDDELAAYESGSAWLHDAIADLRRIEKGGAA